MLYGSIIGMQPFLLCQSKEYKQQVQLERHLGQRPPNRLIPMLPYRDEKTLVTLAFMLCAAVGVAVMLLGGFHVYLTCTGQTTIEFHANWAHRKRARRLGTTYENPYSLKSAWLNFQQVFGVRKHLWQYVIPVAGEPEFLPVPLQGHPGRRHKKEEEEGLLPV